STSVILSSQPILASSDTERAGCSPGSPLSLPLLHLLAHSPLLPEPLDPSGRVHQLLLPCEERVAYRTDLDVNALHRAPRLERVAACTVNRRDLVVGMDPLLHGRPPHRKKGSPRRARNP